jgi:hypothetical protein
LSTANNGWSVRGDAWSLEAFYHFTDRGSSFFVGGYLALQRWVYSQQSLGTVMTSNQFMAMPAAGYRWFPFRAGLFVTVWAGIGIMSPGFLETHSAPERFNEYRIYPFGSLHLGWEV